MGNEFKRTTPEEALERCRYERRGKLKIFLGYAPGVGKTYSMLNEANRRLHRGEDIVIGYLESHGREETDNQVGDLEIIPPKCIVYDNIVLKEMDIEAVISRSPRTVLVDELAHTNAKGFKHKKRYEDVQELLENGINVLTTLNVQHMESLNDIIKKITGVAVRETIPDKIVQNADEVVTVDITPEALQNRLKRGNIYKVENADRALKNFFRKGNLNALREISLRLTAEEVDEELLEYMDKHDINETWPTSEKVLVCIAADNLSKRLVRRGARISKIYKCEWIVAYVNCTHWAAPNITDKGREIISDCFNIAGELGAETISLTGKSISEELIKFAIQNHVTQIVIGHSNRSPLQTFLRGSTVIKILKSARDIEIHVIPEFNNSIKAK